MIRLKTVFLFKLLAICLLVNYRDHRQPNILQSSNLRNFIFLIMYIKLYVMFSFLQYKINDLNVWYSILTDHYLSKINKLMI